MATFKISSLTLTNTPTLDSVVPCVQNGVTKQISVLQIKQYLDDGTLRELSAGEAILCNPNPITSTGTVSFYAPGLMSLYAGVAAPSGWLLCNGNSVAVATYQNLFNTIGYTYGGSGANFNLPNLSNRFVFGPDAMQSSGSNRISQTHAGSVPVLGNTGGYSSATLTSDQSSMPAHNHSFSSTYTIYYGPGIQGPTHGNFSTPSGSPGNSGPVSVTYPLRDISVASTSQSIASQSHDNIPPFLALNYIIKT